MNNQDILNWINYVCNKEQTGRTFTPEQYNVALGIANLRYYKKSYGLPEDYQLQGPFVREVYEKSQYVTDKMRRFKVVMGDISNLAMIVDINGIAPIPSDYFHVSSVRYFNTASGVCNPDESQTDVEILMDAEWADRIGNSITKPSLGDPVCMFQASEIWFRPKAVNYIQFTYLRLPITPVYAYTVNADDSYSYDAANSTEMEWDDIDKIEIAKIILADAGINLNKGDITQYAELLKAKGV